MPFFLQIHTGTLDAVTRESGERRMNDVVPDLPSSSSSLSSSSSSSSSSSTTTNLTSTMARFSQYFAHLRSFIMKEEEESRRRRERRTGWGGERGFEYDEIIRKKEKEEEYYLLHRQLPPPPPPSIIIIITCSLILLHFIKFTTINILPDRIGDLISTPEIDVTAFVAAVDTAVAAVAVTDFPGFKRLLGSAPPRPAPETVSRLLLLLPPRCITK